MPLVEPVMAALPLNISRACVSQAVQSLAEWVRQFLRAVWQRFRSHAELSKIDGGSAPTRFVMASIPVRPDEVTRWPPSA
jgi:hypothetical protein